MTDQYSQTDSKRKRFGWFHILGIVAIVVIIIALLTGWWIKRNIYASQFMPTRLNTEEQQVLNAKLSRLEESTTEDELSLDTPSSDSDGTLQPAPYSEDEARRELRLSEKELNALLAKNTDLAKKLAIWLTIS